eukprot:Hpha_TRINITY_DN16651_c0_g2::TRINITY_DN16651_c0_g2_i5::g.179260::m.179260
MSHQALGLPSHALRGRPDLRCGGGYSSVGNSWAGSPRQSSRRFAPPQDPITKRVRSFDAPGVKALEIVQGGATLWTAEADGSIKVRHALDGTVTTATDEAKATFAPPRDGGICVRLRATATHMWAGYDNGQVRVFDHLVVSQIYPSPTTTADAEEEVPAPHSAAVKFLHPSDNCMYTCDTAGNIIKWLDDPEGTGDFTQLASGSVLETPEQGTDTVWAVAAVGQYVFAGDRNGNMTMSQVVKNTGATEEDFPERFELLHVWATSHSSVTSIAAADGTLFTGGSDGIIRCWPLPTPQNPKPLKEVKVGQSVDKIVVDARAHQVWGVDATGSVVKIETHAPYTTRDERMLNIGPFADVATFTTWDAMRVWSTGSNGANFSWFAQWSRAEEHMTEAIQGMETIIKEDERGLTKWKGMVEELQKVDVDRKAKLVRALESNNARGIIGLYYRKWNLWLHRVWEVQRRQGIADVLARNTDSSLMRECYVRLCQFAHQKRTLRQKRAMCENIMSMTDKGLRRIYWKKIDDYRHRKRAEAQRMVLGEALLANTETGVLRKYFRKCVRYLDRMVVQMKRRKFADVMMRTSNGGLRRLYYFRLVNYRVLCTKKRRARAIGQALQANTRRGLQTMYYRKFCMWGDSLRRELQRKELAEALRRSTQQGLLAAYNAKCDVWLDSKRHENLSKELARHRETLAELQRQEQEQLDLIRQKQEMQALRDELDELNRQQQQLLAEKSKYELEHQALLAQKARKDAHEEDMKSKSMTLDDAMARLKEQALNFDADFGIIEKNLERCISATSVASAGAAKPVLSSFLQSHMNVKAQLANLKGPKVFWDENFWPTKGECFIDECKQKRDAGDESWKELVAEEEKIGEIMNPPWDLDSRFTKIADFQYNMIGPAIKTMVILFDIMTQTDKDEIKTDGEIVINAFNLMHLNENAIRTKERREKKEWTDAWWKSKLEIWKQLWAEYKGHSSWDAFLVAKKSGK